MTKLARAILAVATAAVLAFASPRLFQSGTPAQAADQLERCADLQTDVTNGTFIWAGSAQTCANNNLIVSRGTFVSWIATSGSCPGTANYMIPRVQMVVCKVLRHSFSGSFSTSVTYSCTSSACTQTSSSYTAYTTPSNTAPPVGTGAQLSFTVTSGTYTECGGAASPGTSGTVTLLNPVGGTAQSSGGSGFNYVNGGASGGAYVWKFDPGGTGPSCATGSHNTAGTYTQTYSGNYSASEAY
jgi:hypothetical protein